MSANIKQLSANPRNPRKIEKKKLQMLAKSMLEFGSLDGFIYNVRTKRLAGGHQRQKIMPEDAHIFVEKRHERPTGAGTVAEGYVEYNGERWPYREVDWDEEREKAANIAANKGAGEWDLVKLQDFVVELDEKNFDLDLTMFDSNELKDLFGKEFGSDASKDAIEDDVPETPKEPISKLGDLYELGNHRLLCGDSTDKATVERLMNGEKADMVFTDPPYGVGYKYNAHDDDVTKEEHTKFLDRLIKQSLSLSSNFILTPGCYNLDAVFKVSTPSHVGCWTKTNAMSPGRITHFWTWEPIFFWGKWKRKRGNDVFNFPVGKQPDTGDHTCPKPILLWLDIVENFSEQTELILDLFGGSGTTLIACEKTNRKCYMMELDPHYVDTIVQRYVNYTGRENIKRNGEDMIWPKKQP